MVRDWKRRKDEDLDKDERLFFFFGTGESLAFTIPGVDDQKRMEMILTAGLHFPRSSFNRGRKMRRVCDLLYAANFSLGVAHSAQDAAQVSSARAEARRRTGL